MGLGIQAQMTNANPDLDEEEVEAIDGRKQPQQQNSQTP